jgi:uncharacterized Zn-finger protein
MSDKAVQTSPTHTVATADLPLCCPRPDTAIWNAHPKVYLPISLEKKVTCPYCSATYELIDNTCKY